MNISTIKYHDISNSPGICISVFVSGCRNHCPGCFNPETWSFDYGTEYNQETRDKIITAAKREYITGVSILGGEPLDPKNLPTVLELVKDIKTNVGKPVWIYTGYIYEHLMNSRYEESEDIRKLFDEIDVLVDGPYIDQMRDLNLRFGGSSNQRIIDIKESLEKNRVILWEDKVYVG